MSLWARNPRPDTVRLWLASRVWLFAFLAGALFWGWAAVLLVSVLCDYLLWVVRRKLRRT